jgi:hypothetical protein
MIPVINNKLMKLNFNNLNSTLHFQKTCKFFLRKISFKYKSTEENLIHTNYMY